MKVEPFKTVVLHYQLFDETGELIDSSSEGHPFSFVFGEGSIIPGLERELEGMEPGEEKEIVVQPEDGYGPRNPNLIQQVPKGVFAGGAELEVGMSYTGRTEAGNVVNFTVTGMNEQTVEIDLNHPLAGKTLRFNVTIEEVLE